MRVHPVATPGASRLILFAEGCVRRVAHPAVGFEHVSPLLDAIGSYTAVRTGGSALAARIQSLLRNRQPVPFQADARWGAGWYASEAVVGLASMVALVCRNRRWWWGRSIPRRDIEHLARQARAAAAIPAHPWRDHPLSPDLEPYREAVPAQLPSRVALTLLRERSDPVSVATVAMADAHRDYQRQARAAPAAEEAVQCDLYRDVFGHPRRPPAFDPRWRTSTVLTIARQMDASRDFSPMPILADALQDAGCEDAEVLDHCRWDKPHVRGCWVADLVLDRRY
jgi:hypothetical protein